jgi:Na+/H+-dicarboxylate symporter
MPGTALHVCVAVFFIAQSYGVELSFVTQCLILAMSLFTSFGVAGVPSGSLFAIVTVLTMAGLPAEGVLLTLAVERILDMTRTAVNVYANSCCAVFIAAGEAPEAVGAKTITGVTL